MKRVMLTGASGFIGRHTLPSLKARGFEIHAVSSRDQIGNVPDVTWHRADLFDASAYRSLMALVKPTHLLHFAWYTEHGRYWESPANVAWVETSLGLLRAFTEHGGRRAVFAGTCAECDWSSGICDEDCTPLRPASVYGTCKHALSELLAAHSAATGLNSAWGRIFYLFGPGEKPGRLVPHVITNLLHNKPARCSSGEQRRDFLYVEDAADAFAALLDSKLSGALNIARGELVSAIANQLGKPDLIRLEPTLTDGSPQTLAANIRRLKTELGWFPRIGLDEGMLRTINWWKSHEQA